MMPMTLSAEDFAKKYGGASPVPVTLSADEFQAKYGGPAAQVAYRKDHPPAATHGDPNAEPESTLERVAAPIAHPLDTAGGFLSAVNPLPAMMHPVDAWTSDIAARGAAMDRLRAEGPQLITRDPADPKSGQDLRDMFTYAVPFFGPAMAHAGQQMESPDPVERAKGFGGAVGATSGPKMVAAVTKAGGAALESAGARQTAPMTESIGSQIVAKGGKVFSPQEAVIVEKFKSPEAQQAQLKALADKYPDASVYDDGSTFRVEANRPNANTSSTPAASPPSAFDRIADAVKPLAKRAVAGGIGGAVGSIFGEPKLGAEIGYGAYEAANALKMMNQSPLWRVVSGAVKKSVGQAMQAQDFTTVMNTAAKVSNGSNLEDSYGHDQALFALMQSIPPGADLHQSLQDYDAIYVQPNGSHVQVPFSVQKRTQDALAGHK